MSLPDRESRLAQQPSNPTALPTGVVEFTGESIRQRFNIRDPMILACIMWWGARENAIIVEDTVRGTIQDTWDCPTTGKRISLVGPHDFYAITKSAERMEAAHVKGHVR